MALTMKTGSVHAALRLPKNYITAKRVDGWDTTGGFARAQHHQLRMMTPETGEQRPVFALSVAGGRWKEVTAEEFAAVAKRVLALS